MMPDKSTSNILIRTYLFGAILLISFYGVIFYFSISFAENSNSVKRLAIVGEYYINKYRGSDSDIVKIDPILKIYTDYHALPKSLQTEISEDWLGSSTFYIEATNSEYNVLAKKIEVDNYQKVLYAVEDIEAIELGDREFVIIVGILTGGGLLLFLLASLYIVKTAKIISRPISELAQILTQDDDFEPISLNGKLSIEMQQMSAAMNLYRKKVSTAFEREKSFTRYISHELRTPMSVIKGSISVLNKSADRKTLKQVGLLRDAIEDMESLTRTFLFLAREQIESDIVKVDIELLEGIIAKFDTLIKANEVEVNVSLLEPFELKASDLLLAAAIGNLVSNAVNCSLGGTVNIFVSNKEIQVIDNGVGLDSESRSYEGFGVGLKLVEDICNKYQWHFSLTNNINKGCTASIELLS
jgi:signal transduction histidine kinase